MENDRTPDVNSTVMVRTHITIMVPKKNLGFFRSRKGKLYDGFISVLFCALVARASLPLPQAPQNAPKFYFLFFYFCARLFPAFHFRCSKLLVSSRGWLGRGAIVCACVWEWNIYSCHIPFFSPQRMLYSILGPHVALLGAPSQDRSRRRIHRFPHKAEVVETLKERELHTVSHGIDRIISADRSNDMMGMGRYVRNCVSVVIFLSL